MAIAKITFPDSVALKTSHIQAELYNSAFLCALENNYSLLHIFYVAKSGNRSLYIENDNSLKISRLNNV